MSGRSAGESGAEAISGDARDRAPANSSPPTPSQSEQLERLANLLGVDLLQRDELAARPEQVSLEAYNTLRAVVVIRG